MLRRNVQYLHIKIIKSLEYEGVVIFDNIMTECARAGGRQTTDVELQLEVLQIIR